jgi:hypothetical protein
MKALHAIEKFTVEPIATHKVESQNFLDPVLENLSLCIKLGFKNIELGLT